jgi:transcriptional regulator with XRE-family HTH domain
MTDIQDTLGRRIMSARMRRGVRQAELAREIGISPTSLSLIEKGRVSDPHVSVIRKIALALRVSADFLLGIDEDSEERQELAAAI